MAISLKSVASGGSTTSGAVSCDTPTGVVTGDFLLAVITTSQDSGSSVTGYSASGWTSAAGWNNEGDSQLPASAILWKIATGSEPSSYSFSRVGSASSDDQVVHISRWSGVDPGNPLAVGPVNQNQSSSQRNPVPAPSVTVPNGLPAQAVLVTAHIAMSWYGSAGDGRWSTPSGMTVLSARGLAWAQLGTFCEFVSSGATGTRSSSLSQNPNQQGRGISLGLRPAGTSVPDPDPEPEPEPDPDPDPEPEEPEEPTEPVDPDDEFPAPTPPTTATPPIDRVVLPSNADWSFAIGPPGLITRELNAASSRKVTFNLSDSSEASVTIDGWDPAAREIVELATDLYVFRRADPTLPRQLLYRGRIQKASDSVNEGGHSVTVPSISYRGLLKRRMLMTGFISTNSDYLSHEIGQRWGKTVGGVTPTVDQSTIAWELISGIQNLANGDLGIVRGVGQSTGVMRTRAYQMGDPIADKLDELSEVIDGFDWDITPTYDPSGGLGLQFDLWYPQRGSERNEVLVFTQFGANVQSVQRQVDSGDFANAVRLTGRAPDNGGTTNAVAPAPVERYATPGAEGRWDKMYDEDITTAAGMTERADWRIADSSLIQPSYSVVLKPGVWRGPDHFWLGDTVKLVVQSGRLDVNTDLRVQTIDIDIDDTGEETVSVTLGYPRKDFKSKLNSIERRLSKLERR